MPIGGGGGLHVIFFTAFCKINHNCSTKSCEMLRTYYALLLVTPLSPRPGYTPNPPLLAHLPPPLDYAQVWCYVRPM